MNWKDVLRSMESKMNDRLSGEGASTNTIAPEDREVPPMIQVDVTYESELDEADTAGEPMIFWLGPEMVQVSHLKDPNVKQRVESLTESESGIDANDRTGLEFTFQFDDGYRESRDIADVTLLLLTEVYQVDRSAIISIEWEDMEVGEQLTAAEFVDEYESGTEP